MNEEVENPLVKPIQEDRTVGVGFCDECQSRLFADEIVLEFDGEYFCDDYCLKEYLGVKTIEGWEVKWEKL